MRQQFPLFNTPIDCAHKLWKKILQSGDAVIDATCGNGKDSLAIVTILKEKEDTMLFCIDKQKKAVENTESLIRKEAPSFLSSVQFILDSHENLPKTDPRRVKLIVYNLGYLPGSDKSLTTETSSTLKSVTHALDMICPGGVISISCYPGHPEGKKEQEALLTLLSSLDPGLWCFTVFSWNNRKASPSLLLIQKNEISPSLLL